LKRNSNCRAVRPAANSQGTIFRPGRLGSIVEIKHIKGSVFNSKEAAEEHGLNLCKDWIDKRP
jgi:hypothetical protein